MPQFYFVSFPSLVPALSAGELAGWAGGGFQQNKNNSGQVSQAETPTRPCSAPLHQGRPVGGREPVCKPVFESGGFLLSSTEPTTRSAIY